MKNSLPGRPSLITVLPSGHSIWSARFAIKRSSFFEQRGEERNSGDQVDLRVLMETHRAILTQHAVEARSRREARVRRYTAEIVSSNSVRDGPATEGDPSSAAIVRARSMRASSSL